jgi:hypothetical protein
MSRVTVDPRATAIMIAGGNVHRADDQSGDRDGPSGAHAATLGWKRFA